MTRDECDPVNDAIDPFDGLPEGDGTCLSGFKMDEIAELYAFLENIQEEHGLAVEALDAILCSVRRGESLIEARWFATCEWDL